MEFLLKNVNDKEYEKYIKANIKMLYNFCDEDCEYEKNLLGSRSRKTEEGLKRIEETARKIGMENLVDITDRDRVTIPSFSVEHREKTRSVINFNSGKGVTKEQAKMSAMMEYIERRSAVMHKPTEINTSYNELSKMTKTKIIRPSDLISHYTEFVTNSLKINWLPVVNIIDGSTVLCPSIAAIFNYGDRKEIFLNNSNGLASGQSYHEAIVQGTYEVIERDAISIAFAGGEIQSVPIETIKSDICRKLIDEFTSQGIKIYIKYAKNEFGLPCFMVSGDDTVKQSPLLLSGGFGCHARKEVALIRALTEMSQTRKVILEGKREDIMEMRPKGDTKEEYERILRDHKKWYSISGETIDFDDIEEFIFDNFSKELSWLINNVSNKGFNIYVSNLTVLDIEKEVPVVRVIIPGMENWYHDNKRVGIRLYNKALKVNRRK